MSAAFAHETEANFLHGSIPQTPFSQTVRGTVVDQALQTLLPGATIVLINSQPLKGALTDADGSFRLGRVPVRRQSFKITSLATSKLPTSWSCR